LVVYHRIGVPALPEPRDDLDELLAVAISPMRDVVRDSAARISSGSKPTWGK
jgi:hypothetical protein